MNEISLFLACFLIYLIKQKAPEQLLKDYCQQKTGNICRNQHRHRIFRAVRRQEKKPDIRIKALDFKVDQFNNVNCGKRSNGKTDAVKQFKIPAVAVKTSSFYIEIQSLCRNKNNYYSCNSCKRCIG